MEKVPLDTLLAFAGFVLAVLSLVAAFYLYFVDLRRNLGKIVTEQSQKLDATAAQQLATLRDFHLSIHRHLQALSQDQEGVLTKFQANHLLELYLDGIMFHLGAALDRFSKNDFPKLFQQRDTEAIQLEIFRAYDTVVRKSVRPMISPFRLRGGLMFEDLVTEVSDKGVTKALEDIANALAEALSAEGREAWFIVRTRRILMQAGQVGRGLIRGQLERLYATGGAIREQSHAAVQPAQGG